jgi:ABC-2 type transport system ATP-binding protein
MSNYVIETRELSKYYGKHKGIEKLNLQVEENEIYGFIGPNGAGKSTTIRTLLGLIAPTCGSATIFGKDFIKEKDGILKEIGYMPSEAMFYQSMRVEEIIKLSAKLHERNCDTEAKRLCERLQLDTKKKIEELSLGNRKKVSIVCALQHNPKLFIMDEPTSGLDPLMQKEYFALLKEHQAQGATIFLSSHVLSEVQHYCSRAAIIRDGHLIAQDSVESFLDASTKKVVLRGVSEAPKLNGVKKVEKLDQAVSFLYGGDMRELITGLQGMDIRDMTITEPELEEIFMHIYTGGGEK